MNITFNFDDETSQTVVLEGELLDLMASDLGFDNPMINPPMTEITKDKFVVQQFTKVWTTKLAKKLTQKAINSRKNEIDGEVATSLSSLNGA